MRDVHGSVVKSSIEYVNVPLPVLLKIKKGVLYLPSLYTMTEGLCIGLRESMVNLHSLYGLELYKAIFHRNRMPDRMLGQLILGLKSRPEFFSFTSNLNEISNESATHLSNLIERKNQEPH